MQESTITIEGRRIRLIFINTVVVGSGAAGFNAADRLHQYGQEDVAIVTEGINTGTSRNTGSDKQTYYKLSLSGDDNDSVYALANVLYSGQCVDGDVAMCEAALSVKSFLHLVELGVPFPKNRYGEYVGYKTDHDPKRRATSVGPYTSKMMTECLEKSVRDKNILIFDRLQMIRILTKDGAVQGIICLNLDAQTQDDQYVVFSCTNLILATGGPAGIYADRVYPIGHYGATGIALEAGAKGQNLTEWQFGLASLYPRWNVSGTYMQVLPRFVSCNQDGDDEREFLADYFTDKREALSQIFLKGYQWPFDVRKVRSGSSIIDILVYVEVCLKGRRVFLDFTENPGGEEIDYAGLSTEARTYLEKAGACFGKPIDRLLHMNAPAVEFYRSNGVDLKTQKLEIALCAQHNNGGLAVDCWWQTNIQGLFAAGEVCGSHGVYRPGGSALNAGQVGSSRAAEYIAARRTEAPMAFEEFSRFSAEPIAECLKLAAAVTGDKSNIAEHYADCTQQMSRAGGAIRDQQMIGQAIDRLTTKLREFASTVKISSWKELAGAFRLRETLLCQLVYLSAMSDYIQNGGASRGSALYTAPEAEPISRSLPELFRFHLEEPDKENRIQEVLWEDGHCKFTWRAPRPIPCEDDFFENVWRDFRNNGNVY